MTFEQELFILAQRMANARIAQIENNNYPWPHNANQQRRADVIRDNFLEFYSLAEKLKKGQDAAQVHLQSKQTEGQNKK